jgi:uncharacterized protein (TIGR02266 family)
VSRAVLVLPVRLSVGSRVVQTTTRTVSAAAVYIRCVAPPAPGTAVALRLYLPDGGPEDFDGVVVDAPGEPGPGCKVELKDPTAAQRARITQVLQPPMLERTPSLGVPAVKALAASARQSVLVTPPPEPTPALGVPAASQQPAAHPGSPEPVRLPGPEHRVLVRVPVQLKVRFDSVDAVVDQLAINLSAGGMFIRADPPPPLGAEVTLAIDLPGETEPLFCRAQVAHRVTREEARSTGQITGVGVQFLDADDRFRTQIDGYIARAQGLTPLEE